MYVCALVTSTDNGNLIFPPSSSSDLLCPSFLPSCLHSLPFLSCSYPPTPCSLDRYQSDEHVSKSVRGGSSPSMSWGVRNERNITGSSGGMKGSIARRCIKSPTFHIDNLPFLAFLFSSHSSLAYFFTCVPNVKSKK